MEISKNRKNNEEAIPLLKEENVQQASFRDIPVFPEPIKLKSSHSNKDSKRNILNTCEHLNKSEHSLHSANQFYNTKECSYNSFKSMKENKSNNIKNKSKFLEGILGDKTPKKTLSNHIPNPDSNSKTKIIIPNQYHIVSDTHQSILNSGQK
jgi:hypothetical protein